MTNISSLRPLLHSINQTVFCVRACMFCFSYWDSTLQASTRSGKVLLCRRFDWRAHVSGLCLFAVVPLHEFGDVKLGLLQDLDLADVTVLDGEDRVGGAGDLFTDGGADQFLDERSEIALGSQFGHVRCHLCSDGADLGALGVACGLDLVVLRLRERDAEESDDVPVGCAAVNGSLDDTLLLTDQGAELVAGHVHAMEVEQAVEPLHILDAELDLAPADGLVLVEVGQGDLDDASLQVFRGDLLALCLGNQGLAAVLDGEHRRSDELVPFLLQEGVDRLFAASLLGLRQSLVFSDSHLEG
mmetsp:Transcript_14038/g.40011  ORF Transcript_14038/g.40011 Transcript_14038/m.40011 type:complete len:300 (+) Transcript_14038:137-1036(+)